MNYYDPEAWEAHEARMAGPEEDDSRCLGCGEELDIRVNAISCTTCSGEGDDMATEEQMTGEVPWETQLRFLLEQASDLQLKAARYAVETEQKKRLEDAQATIRALDPNAPKPRATRKDAGTKRAPKPANEVLRDKEGVAV